MELWSTPKSHSGLLKIQQFVKGGEIFKLFYFHGKTAFEMTSSMCSECVHHGCPKYTVMGGFVLVVLVFFPCFFCFFFFFFCIFVSLRKYRSCGRELFSEMYAKNSSFRNSCTHVDVALVTFLKHKPQEIQNRASLSLCHRFSHWR